MSKRGKWLALQGPWKSNSLLSRQKMRAKIERGRRLLKKYLFRNTRRKVKAPAVKCIGRSQAVSNEEMGGGGEGISFSREEERRGTRGISVSREGSANGVANEYRVWIREEPIGVRDVLPRSREKRQSGASHRWRSSRREGWGGWNIRGMARRFDDSTCPGW